jgi:excisionase family DNA binding protein
MENQNNRIFYESIFKEYPDVVNVPQLCEMMGGISAKTAYRLLKSGAIKSLNIGKGYKIPKIFVLEYLTSPSEKSLA